MNHYPSGERLPKVADVHVVALYQPSSGKIVYVHSVTVFEGARAVSEQEAVETARSLARKAGHAVQKLEVKPSKDVTHGSKRYHIDVSSGKFIPVARAKRGRTSGETV